MTAAVAGCVAAILFSATAFAVEPLQCPAGTTRQSLEKVGHDLAEWCVNAEGKRQGPQREFRGGRLAAEGTNDVATGQAEAKIYNEAGVLTNEIRLEGRKIIWHRLTLAGLEEFLAPMNREWHGRDPSVSFRAIDAQTVGMDFHFKDADAEKGAQKLDFFRAYVRRDFCKLLSGPEEIHAIEVRVLNDKTPAPAMTTRVERADCVAQVSE